MIKEELYNRTVGILYDAYFNDTLQHDNCYACAVGNLIAGNCGYGFKKSENACAFQNLYWDSRPASIYNLNKLIDDRDLWFNKINSGSVKSGEFTSKMIGEIQSTGYEPFELAKIEDAFETAPIGYNGEDWMFNGLAAVLEVLKEIHQVTDEDLLQANNKRFKDHYAKRVSAAV